MAKGPSGKGDCYEVAAKLVGFDFFDGVVAQGMVTGTGKVAGVRFGHAWIEKDGLVYDFSNGKADNPVVMPRELYYLLGRIDSDEVVKYDSAEAKVEMLRTGHFGPWRWED